MTRFEIYRISIHRLLAEPDQENSRIEVEITISIHRLLAEPDSADATMVKSNSDFNPQAPCGARLM